MNFNKFLLLSIGPIVAFSLMFVILLPIYMLFFVMYFVLTVLVPVIVTFHEETLKNYYKKGMFIFLTSPLLTLMVVLLYKYHFMRIILLLFIPSTVIGIMPLDWDDLSEVSVDVLEKNTDTGGSETFDLRVLDDPSVEKIRTSRSLEVEVGGVAPKPPSYGQIVVRETLQANKDELCLLMVNRGVVIIFLCGVAGLLTWICCK